MASSTELIRRVIPSKSQRVGGLSRRSGLVSKVTQTPLGNQKFQPLPSPTGASPFHLSLDTIVSPDQMDAIKSASTLVFHTVGDTGNLQGTTVDQQRVADAMEADSISGAAPAFFYHLGDVVYFWGQPDGYYPQFYEPYLHYPKSIIGIPGNHDADPRPGDPASLTAFARNFCAKDAVPSVDSHDSARPAMTEPNVYWTLEAPFLTIVGLYSNVPEGGAFKPDQLAWLVRELKTAPVDKALVLAVHHPVYSLDTFHAGSTTLEETLDSAYLNSGRYPDLVLTAHVHNFQRFTEVVDGRQIPHIVAGAGGHLHLHSMQKQPDGSPLQVPFKLQDADDTTLENYCEDRHGFMRLAVTDQAITGQYFAVSPSPGPPQSQIVDSFVLDYKAHALTKSTRVP